MSALSNWRYKSNITSKQEEVRSFQCPYCCDQSYAYQSDLMNHLKYCSGKHNESHDIQFKPNLRRKQKNIRG